MLEINDHYELIALNKALFEARFHENPDHPEVQGSPLVAAIHNRLIDTLISHEKEQANQSRWQEWRQWRNRVMERKRVEQIIRRTDWAQLSAAHKEDFIRILVAPFIVNEEEVRTLINFGDQFHDAK